MNGRMVQPILMHTRMHTSTLTHTHTLTHINARPTVKDREIGRVNISLVSYRDYLGGSTELSSQTAKYIITIANESVLALLYGS